MLAATDWTNLTVAGAFVAGAVLASFATIRVVRAVSIMFAELEERRLRGRHRPRPGDTDAGD